MRSKDRLEEFHRRAAAAATAVYGETVCALDPPPPPHCQDLEHVCQEAERIDRWVRDIVADTRLMQRLHADAAFHGDHKLQEQLEDAEARAHAAGLKAAAALRQLEEHGRELAATQGGGAVAARAARLLGSGARRRLVDALSAHHALLAAQHDHQRALLAKQLTLVAADATQEECERLLDGEGDVALFTGNVVAATAAARLALRDAEARRDQLRRVERALGEVNDLFHQLAALVAAQQEQIDTVEYFALQAGALVDRGQTELLKGQVTRKRAKRKKMSLVICVAAGALVVLLVLVLT